MEAVQLTKTIEQLIHESGKFIDTYMQNEEDRRIANGNVSVCIIDDEGNIFGRMFGTNKVRARESFRVAWTKASQVHITGFKTGEFEKKAFNEEIDETSKIINLFLEGGENYEYSSSGKLLGSTCCSNFFYGSW